MDILREIILFIEDEWKILTIGAAVVTWVSGAVIWSVKAEYRIRTLEKSPKKRDVDDCDNLMSRCSVDTNRRFSDGRRDQDGLVMALNRLSDHVEADIKSTNEKLDKIYDHLLRINQ